MLSTVYVSEATFEFSDDDLATLLMKTRANNARLGLTGILLHREGRFMQVLEGPTQVVLDRFAFIAEDPRHRKIQKLIEEHIKTRQFPGWTMGYSAVTDTLANVIPGYDDFFAAPRVDVDSSQTVTRARRLLEWFRDNSLAPIAAP